MRINKAATKRSETGSYPSTASSTSEDATNTTIFIGGLDQSVGEDQLKKFVSSSLFFLFFASGTSEPRLTVVFILLLSTSSIFQVYGEIALIKMFSGKGWAFITFSQHQPAERAILEKNGSIIGLLPPF